VDLLLDADVSNDDAAASLRHIAAMHISQVSNDDEIALVRSLMREYQQALGVDLCFQNFATELAQLPGSYAPPTGRLLLAMHEGVPVGCAALQAITRERCEMKRLYIRPIARGLGLGRALVQRILDEAKATGYIDVVLDTLPSMAAAQRLYEQFGFHEIEAYRPNPIAGTRYLRKVL
jgi:GNAT superfamily N-acetyltransferase